MEAALIDLKAQLQKKGKLGGAAAATPNQAALSKQLQEMEARLATKLSAPATGGGDAPLAAKLSALADSGGGCGGMQQGVHELQQGVGELHLEVKRAAEGSAEKAAQSGRALEASVGRLESTMGALKSRMATLESNQHEDAVGRKALQARATPLGAPRPLATPPRHAPLPRPLDTPLTHSPSGTQAQLSSLLQLSGEIKQAQAASSSGGWLMPTLVCGQMLALAAFLFHRSVAKDKKRDHFL